MFRYVSLSVRMEQLGSPWTDFHEIWYVMVFRKTAEKIQIHWTLTITTGTSHEYLCTCMTIAR